MNVGHILCDRSTSDREDVATARELHDQKRHPVSEGVTPTAEILRDVKSWRPRRPAV